MTSKIQTPATVTEAEVNAAAAQFIPAEFLPSFLEMSINSKLVGLAVLAKGIGREDLVSAALNAYNALNA